MKSRSAASWRASWGRSPTSAGPTRSGNFVARKAGRGPRLMLCAHMDEIAFMVQHIEDSGFLRVLPLGGFDAKTLTAQRVIVHGREDLLGVMGTTAVHLMSEEDRKRPPKLEDFYVDVGLPAERVRELVRPGDVVTRERELARLGNLVTSKSLDNRAGLYVLVEAMRALGAHECEIFAVAAVQEEVGLRGARVAAARIRPQVALAMDITLANDGPGTAAHQHVSTIGGGAAIKVYDTSVIVPARRGRAPARGGRCARDRPPAGDHAARRAPTRGSSSCRVTARSPGACRSRPGTSTSRWRRSTPTISTRRSRWSPRSARPPRRSSTRRDRRANRRGKGSGSRPATLIRRATHPRPRIDRLNRRPGARGHRRVP